MGIRAALDRLVVVESALAITAPVKANVKKAYKTYPKKGTALSAPCMMNGWTLRQHDRFVALREQRLTISIQLFADDADTDRAADIAAAFYEVLVDALDDDVTLNGNVTDSVLRGGDPTLAGLEWDGRVYVGLQLFLDVTISEARAFGP